MNETTIKNIEVERMLSEWSNEVLIRNGLDASIAIRNSEITDLNNFGVGTLIGELALRLGRYSAAKNGEGKT